MELEKKFLAELINNNINDWMKITIENKDLFIEDNYKIYEEFRFRRTKKKSIIIK